MNDRLLPMGSTQLELAAAKACAELQKIKVPLRELWNPDTCPATLLPYLAWAWSVDRWDEHWSESIKREVIKSSLFLHKHKGTIGAIRRVVEPLGYLIRVKEWWQTNDVPGTFRLDIGVLENGITHEMFEELEKLISDAKPVSRHLIGLDINLDTRGEYYYSAASYSGDELVVYPYFPEQVTVSGSDVVGMGIHIIDDMRIRP
ncbi:phage tail protein I [Xenorhabdus bovienii]|uniref:Tail protein I (GpI) n=2 Tax=Xenorhabdus bovienii TaxID=40576 RepID=A0A077PKQ4_XENBV|nr:phage tail protein I [Xenorhabdus bovienii]MCG3469017.1 phage tail protein I [Xenorhabdus bovienii]MCP9268528.1 phage tail protein I [Xenorhabdus bovienii subsp. africana]MDE1486361.1 phage tail protein I [Xenorhabdus bovienii]MDE1497017.1 phage tail protein I [Xenorhabdus bovienii]MDE9441327.1 phage tail protein I [Xenorhabdus bovienii]